MPKKKKRSKKQKAEEELLEVEEDARITRELEDADQLQKDKIDFKNIKVKDSDALKVAESVLDVETKTTLFNLRKRNIIDYMTGVISTGKEANVYHGYAPDGSELAIKIYRTSTNIFKGLQIYIIGDPRFARIKRDQRSFVYAWAKKEFKNLSRAYKAKVSIPKPITCVKDVVVMEFIGKKELPYPLMKDVKLKKPRKTYMEVLDNLELLYHDAGLVHADLSEYNMIYTPKVYFIDISQAVLLDHSFAEIFLYRDIKNITRYFKAQKVDVIEAEDLFEKLTGEPLTDRVKAFEF
ncbi:MAG: serine protein kinase RIO [Candidatus Heimdallarchaeota archaeon]|nr:serine protein kinase RIO [Candidatus Heimdallarchaeota archaeon]